MGGFYTSNVAKIELHDFVAIVNLQAHCIWFQRRNFVKLTIKHVVIGGATNDVAPRHEPKSLIIKLMRRFDICAAVLVVQEVVYLFVEFSSLRVAHRKAPVGHVVLVLELVHQHPHAAFYVLVNQAHIKLEEGQVGAPTIGREIHTVVVAETDKKRSILNVAGYLLLSPSIKGWSKLGSKVAQHDEFGTGERPLQNGGP